ncbi:MAG: ornithine carbamoyltransferase, partial [Oscillospiraceae bacterium]|nr:ornithine carbamoyltransferase [Oscillospiraceae bacterium]
ADVLYMDTWISMGKESESALRISLLKKYEINKELVSLANKDVMVLHCLPAYRGKEITEEIFEQFAGTIFDQAENRLHTQKAIMDWMTD